MKIRILSAADARRAMPMIEAIRVVRQAFVELSAGRAAMPIRTRVDVPSRSGTGLPGISLQMPAFLEGERRLATKIVSIFPGNLTRESPLPTIHAVVVVVDPDTGEPVGLLEGGSLTAIRTGAASGAATAELAGEGVTTAGVLGAGVQARTQLEAMVAARPGIERASVYDPRRDAAESFAAEMTERLGLPVETAEDADSVVAASEVIAEATTASTPIFSDASLRDDAHLNAVGSFTPEMQILPEATVVRSAVVVDHRESCWEEAGDLIQPRDRGAITESHLYAEFGEIASGRIPKPPPGRPTLFKTVGTAVQDAAVGAAALTRAAELGLGVVVDL